MEKLKRNYLEYLTKFEEQKNTMRRLWNIDEQTAHLIMMLIMIKKPERILEIGTSNGFSSFMMSIALKLNDGIIDTIEVDEKRFKLAETNIGSIQSIRRHFGKAEDIIPTLPYQYDLIFIDANKSCYQEYLKLVIDKLNDDAIIIADNIQSHEETTKEYQDFLKNDVRFITIQVNIDSGILISKYKKQID